MDTKIQMMECVIKHLLEICSERKKFRNIKVEWEAHNKKTWHTNNTVTMRLTCKSQTTVAAKIFCESSHLSNETVLRELFSHGVKMQRLVLRIERLLDVKISPTFLFCSKKFRFLFEEDVSKEGYLAKSPEKGLSLDESKEAIKLMARLHAGSVALHEKKPSIAKTFKIRNILQECGCMMQMFRKSLKKAVSFMKKTYPLVAEGMEDYRDITIEQIIDLYNYDSEEFCVLNHGDFCISNLSFKSIIEEDEEEKKEDEEKEGGPILLNYQMAVYSSPAIDLLHFLNTSSDITVMYEQDKQLLELYLKTLRGTMRSLNCRTLPPTMEQLKAAIRKRILYAVFAGITFKLNTMIAGEDEENNIHYEELAKKMLLIMYYRNYFNYKKKRRSSSSQNEDLDLSVLPGFSLEV